MLVGHGTCWRDPVQAAEMWRVTLKVTNKPIRLHRLWKLTHIQPKKKKKKKLNTHIQHLQLLLEGDFWVNAHSESHILTQCLTPLSPDLIGRTSRGFVLQTDSSPEKTEEICSFQTSCRKIWVNSVTFLKFFFSSWNLPSMVEKKKSGDSLRKGCILLVPQGALHHVVQQQGAAPADQRRRCPNLGSSWPVAEKKQETKIHFCYSNSHKEVDQLGLNYLLVLFLFWFLLFGSNINKEHLSRRWISSLENKRKN